MQQLTSSIAYMLLKTWSQNVRMKNMKCIYNFHNIYLCVLRSWIIKLNKIITWWSRYYHHVKHVLSEKNSTMLRARASTIVLRFSLWVTSYREQYLQIYQVLRHQTSWEWRCQKFCFETSNFDFRSNLKRQHFFISVLYRLIS